MAKGKQPAVAPADSMATLRTRMSEGKRVYHPHLAEWWVADTDRPNVFALRHVADNREEFTIAEIHMNPVLGEKDSEAVQRLITYAPQLWQKLRDIAPDMLNDCESCEAFAQAQELLWATAERPWDWPEHNTDDELFQRLNADLTAALRNGKAKGAKPKKAKATAG